MVSTMYLKITELHYQNIKKNAVHVCLFSIIAKYQNEGTLHNKRLFRKLSHTFQPKRRHFQGNKQWKMMSFREWHRYTQEKRTRCATIRSRSYDRPISTSEAPPLSCRRLVADRLTESMMTNFLHAARKGMSIVRWGKPIFTMVVWFGIWKNNKMK